MSKKKQEKNIFDLENMTQEELLKFEIAEELGLKERVLSGGWRALTSKESGRIGGLMTKRKRQMREESMKKEGSAEKEGSLLFTDRDFLN